MIVIAGAMFIDPQKMGAFESHIEAHSANVRAAEGCLLFSIGVVNRASGELCLAEFWRSRADLERWHAKPYTPEFVRLIGASLKRNVKIFDVTGLKEQPRAFREDL
jgi:quinol monooxygenase YgiN